MVFCDLGIFSKSLGKPAFIFIRDFFERTVWSDSFGRIFYDENPNTGKKDGISSISDSGRNLDHALVTCRNQVSASLTVEAAIVMAIVLSALGFIIKESCVLYDEVTGAMILEEALENSRYSKAGEKKGEYFAEKGEQQGNPRLRLGKYEITIAETNGWVKGRAEAGRWQKQIEMRRHDPERFLRRIQALLEKRCMPDDDS